VTPQAPADVLPPVDPDVEGPFDNLYGNRHQDGRRDGFRELRAIGSKGDPGQDFNICHGDLRTMATYGSERPDIVRMEHTRDVDGLLRIAGSDLDPDVREAAVRALGDLGDDRAVDPLIAALGQSQEIPLVWVREAIVRSLGKIGDARAVEPLIAELTDSDSGVRETAIASLGQIGDVRAVEPLIAVLGEPFHTLREAAIRSLGELGDARAVEPLIAVLGDRSDSLREAAATALGAIGDPCAADPLTAAGTVASTVHPFTIRVMAELGIDISGQRSKDLGAFIDQEMDVVVTVCDAAAATCPMFPGAKRTIHASFPDPSAATGTDEERLAVFRGIRDEIAAWIDAIFGDGGCS
jgi:protein-tyrosine-phosphatase